MHVIFNTTRLQRRASEIPADPYEVGVDALAKLLVLKKRAAVFGGKDDVQVDLD